MNNDISSDMQTGFPGALASGDGATQAATVWLSSFAEALKSGRADAVPKLFQPDCHWRDLVIFTWNIVTLEGHAQIADMLQQNAANIAPSLFQLEGPADSADDIVSAWFTFETSLARGRGHVRLREGKCWTLFTNMVELKGFEEAKGRRRIKGTDHQPSQEALHWPDARKQETEKLGYGDQPYCVIIGGGQSGIILAARLRRLNVPTIVIDKGSGPGNVWRGRYKSLYLHDPVWFDHLPYIPFPDDWPIFTPAQKMADWLEAYTKVNEINYWHSTECMKAVFDAKSESWTVDVLREGKPVTLRPQQLVVATGLFGTPRIPDIAGLEDFEGRYSHSSQQFDVEAYTGKKCIVVGANSSGHDMAVNLWENKADVTLIQRKSTMIVRSSTMMDALSQFYSEAAVERGITADLADDMAASVPFKLLAQFQIPLYRHIREIDSDFYARLERAGYNFDFGEDETGITVAAFRGRGFYIDVGGGDLIAGGKIGLAQGDIDHFTKNSIVMADGRELPAELVVFATGYHPITTAFAKLFGQDIADGIGRCWGYGSGKDGDPGPWEGEIRNMWKPLPQKNLWIMAGNFAWGRYYSRFLSLQIKARMENLKIPIYKIPETLRF